MAEPTAGEEVTMGNDGTWPGREVVVQCSTKSRAISRGSEGGGRSIGLSVADEEGGRGGGRGGGKRRQRRRKRQGRRRAAGGGGGREGGRGGGGGRRACNAQGAREATEGDEGISRVLALGRGSN